MSETHSLTHSVSVMLRTLRVAADVEIDVDVSIDDLYLNDDVDVFVMHSSQFGSGWQKLTANKKI